MKKVFFAILMGWGGLGQGVMADQSHGLHRHAVSYVSRPVEGQGLGRSFSTIGTVRKVDFEHGIVTIFHQPIAALMWPSMTMPFAVGDKTMLERLKVGEQVEFEFTRDNKKAVITRVKQ